MLTPAHYPPHEIDFKASAKIMTSWFEKQGFISKGNIIGHSQYL